MRIGVTSQNELKVNAVAKAYSAISDSVEVVGYTADSKVGEQPVNEQTFLGALQRTFDVEDKVNDLDRIVSIESGIFEEDGQWLDKAVVVIYDPRTGKGHYVCSDAVAFPNEYVEKARQRGFETTTVGQVMEEEGFVSNRKDPHLSISGVSRQVYIERTVRKLVEEVERKA